jgi:hypothetical protein
METPRHLALMALSKIRKLSSVIFNFVPNCKVPIPRIYMSLFQQKYLLRLRLCIHVERRFVAPDTSLYRLNR